MASLMEMVDITDLKSVAIWRASSSLAGGTNLLQEKGKTMNEGYNLLLMIAITLVGMFVLMAVVNAIIPL